MITIIPENLTSPVDLPVEVHDGIVATGVSLEDYERLYAWQRCEYVEGTVIKMGQNVTHDALMRFLEILFSAYFELRPIGRIVTRVTIKLPEFPQRRREPDLMVILNTNPHQLEETFMDGPADICIEVVSPESTERDYGEKFVEYEIGKVPEYWLIDPLRQQPFFYRRSEAGLYKRIDPDSDGHYRTPQLPGLALPVAMLWQKILPGPIALARLVQKMLTEQKA